MEEKKTNYVYIEKDVLEDSVINPKAKLLYIYLCRRCGAHGGSFCVSMEAMAEDMKENRYLDIDSRKTISSLINQLSEAGYLKVERGRLNCKNTYRCRKDTDRRIIADINKLADLETVYEKLIYIVVSNSETPLSKEDISARCGIKLSSMKKALYSLVDKQEIASPPMSGRARLYGGFGWRLFSEDTGEDLRQAVESWLGRDYFICNTGLCAEAAVMIRDAVLRDYSLADKIDRDLYYLYCNDRTDPEKVIEAFVKEKKSPNCTVFLRDNAAGERLKEFGVTESGAKKGKRYARLHDTSFNYFMEHEKLMIYARRPAVQKEQEQTDRIAMINALDGESFMVNMEYCESGEPEEGRLCRLFLKSDRRADGSYSMLYCEPCRPVQAQGLTEELWGKLQENTFLAETSGRKGSCAEGIAFIRREDLLMMYRASLILSKKSFPNGFPLPEGGCLLRFEGKLNSFPKKTMEIQAEHIEFLMPSHENRRAFLEYIIGLDRNTAEELDRRGFPEAAGLQAGCSSCLSCGMIKTLAAAGMQEEEARKAACRCLMACGRERLTEILCRGFYCSEDEVRLGNLYFERLYNKYNLDALFELTRDPYILLEISAETGGYDTDSPQKYADLIARSLGFEYDSPERLRALTGFAVTRAVSDGDTGITLEALEETLKKYDTFGQYPDRARLIAAAKETEGIVYNGDVYTESGGVAASVRTYGYEDSIVRELMRINKAGSFSLTPSDSRMKALLRTYGADEDKYEAVKSFCSHNISIITGSAGTGKSLAIRMIVSLCKSCAPDLKTVVCAPTGKAADNLAATIEGGAVTVHSLLSIDPSEPERLPEKLSADVVILDEASMLDTALSVILFSSLKDGARLVMVGDKDQLPPVGGGRVFADIVESGLFPFTQLRKIYRQDKDSSILNAAERIKCGEWDIERLQDSCFCMKKYENEGSINSVLIKELRRAYRKDDPFGTQVIVPVNRHRYGVNGINKALQDALNPLGTAVSSGLKEFRQGDKVVFTKTKYSKDHSPRYVNGQTGIVTKVTKKPMKVTVTRPDGEVELDFDEINDALSLAYAMTIHKSQGSQFDEVFVVLPKTNGNFVTRNMLYTAVTRARKRLTLIYAPGELRKAVENQKDNLTLLREKLLKHLK